MTRATLRAPGRSPSVGLLNRSRTSFRAKSILDPPDGKNVRKKLFRNLHSGREEII